MKKALLTGGQGFLGRYLREALEKAGYHVDTLGRGAGNTISGDLTTALPPLTGQWNLVVHAAGKAHSIPVNATEARAFYAVNTDGTRNLCDALVKGGSIPAAFVFISTVAVYGLQEGEAIAESHPLEGNTPYALSKIAAENFLSGWAATQGTGLTILRLPLVAGANPPGNLGALIEGIRRGRYFNIGSGRARKSMVLAEDVADWLPVFAAHPGTYNLTDGEHPGFGQLAAMVARQLGKPQPRSIPFWLARIMALAGNLLGSRAPINTDKLLKITATLTFDDSRARKAFGWNPHKVLGDFKIN